MKPLLTLLGFLTAILIISQLVMGVLIRTGSPLPWLRTAHFHSGTLMAVVSLVYIGLSLAFIGSSARRDRA